MKIKNLRLGFACNSSSSHSLIIMKDLPSEEYTAGEDFGWDDFTLVTRESKLKYLHSYIAQSLGNVVPNNLAKYIADGMLGVKMSDGPHIDHNSLGSFPYSYNGEDVNDEFLNDFIKFVLHKNTVILGGNDNSDGHPLEGDGERKSPRNIYGKCVARKDGDWYSFFDRDSGHRFTFSFFEKPSSIVLKSPYLVDLKITDYCSYGCPFCYQGSTKKGKHADIRDITEVLHTLNEHEVFEVALGGGEPTEHPDFNKIIQVFRYQVKIIPNFTTKNIEYLKGEDFIKNVYPYIGRVAISCESIDDIKSVCEVWRKNELSTKKLSVQVIDKVISKDSFKKLLEYISNDYNREVVKPSNVTLLGYKDNNRGGKFSKTVDTDWYNTVTDLKNDKKYFNLSVDTKIIQEYSKDVLKICRPELYHSEEGLYSLYVDCVNKTVAPSSYTSNSYHSFSDADEIIKIYNKMNKLSML